MITSFAPKCRKCFKVRSMTELDRHGGMCEQCARKKNMSQDFCEICGEPSDDLYQGVCPNCLMEGEDSDFAEDEDEDIEESESRELNPHGLVSVWLSKEKFPQSKGAFRWLLDHGFETRIRSTDNFWSATQDETLVRKYRSKIRSKYIASGVMIRFVPSQFIE